MPSPSLVRKDFKMSIFLFIWIRMGRGEGFTMRNFIVYTVHLIKIRLIKSRRLKWVGHLIRMTEGRSPFKIVTRKPTGMKSLGMPKHRWKDNLEWVLKNRCQYQNLNCFSTGWTTKTSEKILSLIWSNPKTIFCVYMIVSIGIYLRSIFVVVAVVVQCHQELIDLHHFTPSVLV